MDNMIEFTDEIDLTIAETSDILAKLVKLKKKKNVDLPLGIRGAVKDLVDAQAQFVKSISSFLHLASDKDFDTVKTIVKAKPQFLAKKDTSGRLPIHSLAIRGETCKSIFLLVAREGIKNGLPERGGILLKDSQGQNVLQLLVSNISSRDFFRFVDPPLFHQDDIRNLHLLHHAVQCRNKYIVQFFILMDPKSVLSYDEHRNLPLYYCISKTKFHTGIWANCKEEKMVCVIFEELLRTAFRNWDESLPTLGGLLKLSEIVDGNYDIILNALVKTCGETKTWDIIQKACASYENLPFLHQIIEKAPDQFNTACFRFPDCIYVRDKQNRLPLHVALATGKINYSLELLFLVQQGNLDELDPVTKLPPFLLAASKNCCDLSTIYFLLRKTPKHIQPYCKHINYSYSTRWMLTKFGHSWPTRYGELYLWGHLLYLDEEKMNRMIIEEYERGIDALMTTYQKQYFDLTLDDILTSPGFMKEQWCVNVIHAREHVKVKIEAAMKSEKHFMKKFLKRCE